MQSKGKGSSKRSSNGKQGLRSPENPHFQPNRDVTGEDKDAEIVALKEDVRLKAEKLSTVLSEVKLLRQDIEGLSKSKESLEGSVKTLSKELESKEDMLKKERESIKSLSEQVSSYQVEKTQLLKEVEQSQAKTLELFNMVTDLQSKVSEVHKREVTVKPDGEAQGINEASLKANGIGKVEDAASEDISYLDEDLRENLVDVKAERAEAKERAELWSREVSKSQSKVAPWDAGDSLVKSRSRSLWRELDDTQKELSQLRAERDFLARKIKTLEAEDEWDKPTLLKKFFPFWDSCRSSWVQ